ncbi:MAG: response regulator [bacterium]|nr:response regulator [bacterium]
MVEASDIKKSTILIIDDEINNLELIEAILAHEGYRHIITLNDPRQALQIYRDYHPELVLLDLQMPHLSGFQVMDQLRNEEPDGMAPILILTGMIDREVRLRSLAGGARDFLTKPFDPSEALSRIRNLIEMRLMNKQLKNQNRWLDEKVSERTEELHTAQLEMVQRLARAAEYRDDVTGFHIIRMSLYCKLLAKAVGFSDQESQEFQLAATVHDIGKIGIRDEILLKPGKLTPEEWEQMKQHTLIGADMLADGRSRVLQTAHLIALTHHEKWDGSGYPCGLKGEEIPLAGRICAIADVFDALTSPRPYKEAWTVEATLDHIVSKKGEHFDPDLVDQFIQVLPEILEIKEKYTDLSFSPIPSESKTAC